MKATVATIESVTCKRNRIQINVYELRVYYDNNKRMKGKGYATPDFSVTRTSGHGSPQWFLKVRNQINDSKPIDLVHFTETEKQEFLNMVKSKGQRK